MTTSLAENPAVVEPRKYLTPAQQDALLSIGHFKNYRRIGPEILIGKKRFKLSTIAAIEKLELVRMGRGSYAPTLAGEMAIERLKGGSR